MTEQQQAAMPVSLYEAARQTLEALEEIALAGMSGTGQESDEAITEWHARQAWKFIRIAARSLPILRQALEQPAPKIDYRAECWLESPHYKPKPEQPAQPQASHTFYDADGNVAMQILDSGKVSMDSHISSSWAKARQPAPVPEAHKQESVYFCDYGSEGWGKVDAAMAAENLACGMTVEAYYTRPQNTTPLTDGQICQALGIDGSDDWTFTVARAIEAAHGITSGTAALGEKK